MPTDRNKLCTGLLSKNSLFSFTHLRKIIFNYDNVEHTGYDLINQVSYPINKPESRKGYYISNVICLNGILQQLGYPEKLDDVHIEKIWNDDFNKVFIESGILRTLYSCTMEEYLTEFCQSNMDIVQNEFTMHEEEVNVKQKYKRR